MPGWKGSTRRDTLPKDWRRRVAATEARAGGRCERILANGIRCPYPGAEADHRTHRLNHDDLEWLCHDHHMEKTQLEAHAAKRKLAAMATHPQYLRRNPGLL